MVFLCIALTLTAAACSTSTKASTTSVPTPVSSSPSSTETSPAVTSSTENSAKIAVDLGLADQINLHEAWLQIAKARSFDATTARAWDVTLDYSPSGSLVSLFLIAVTADSREARVTWDGYHGHTDQVVLASVTTAFSSGGPESVTDYSMYSVLAAIDAVGAKNITAKLPGPGAGGNYELGLMFLDAYKGALPPKGAAYSWDGSAFQPLSGSARSLQLDSQHAGLSAVAREPVASTTTTLSASTSSTYLSTVTTSPYESIGIACFVVPVTSMIGATTTSAETTTTSQLKQSDVRIGVMIPADILYKGRIYAGDGQVVRVASNTPADLSVVGSGPAADVTGAPIPDSQYVIYAIKGIDQGKAIAVRFRGASNDGPAWVWLKYERNT